MPKADVSVVDLAIEEETIEGCAFLVEEKKPRQSLVMCEKYLAEGASLLVVSRDPPRKLLEGTSLEPKKTIWITNLPGKDHIDPTSVGLLMGEVKKFAEESRKKAVVLIDGLEFLISVNTYDRMLQFIHQMRDLFVTSGSVLIMPFDMRTIDEREQALLERNLQVIVVSRSSQEEEHVIQISSEESIGT